MLYLGQYSLQCVTFIPGITFFVGCPAYHLFVHHGELAFGSASLLIPSPSQSIFLRAETRNDYKSCFYCIR